MFRITALSLVLASCLLVLIPEASAQQVAELAELYGDGVHAYFAGDYQESYQSLSSAVEGGTTDPRVYFFRGLALEQLGRGNEAEADFATGARQEVRDVHSYYNVSRALERVQGAERLTIEHFRQQARIEAAQRAQREYEERYERTQRDEAAVLRRPVTPPEEGELLPVPGELEDPGEDLFSAEGGLTGEVREVPEEESLPAEMFQERPTLEPLAAEPAADAGEVEAMPLGGPGEEAAEEDSSGSDLGDFRFGTESSESEGGDSSEGFSGLEDDFDQFGPPAEEGAESQDGTSDSDTFFLWRILNPLSGSEGAAEQADQPQLDLPEGFGIGPGSTFPSTPGDASDEEEDPFTDDLPGEFEP